MNEEEIKQKLAELKHQIYLAKREGQLARFELRINLMRERAREALAAGLITEDDVQNVRSKWEAFKAQVAALKAAGGVTTKEGRAACTTAWDELQAALQATREKAAAAAAR